MSNLLESKSLLAKLMATENIQIEQKKVSTACFDVQNRVLTVPILSDDIGADTYDLFMGHEVGHALYTPYEGLKVAHESGENMSAINLCEDSRIERKIKYKYPGIKNAFVRAYAGLFAENFFNTDGKNLDQLNFLDRINLHCKIGAALNIQFTDEERSLLNEVESTQTFEEVVEVSRKIVQRAKEERKEKKEEEQVKIPNSDPKPGDDDGAGDAEGKDSTNTEDNGEGQDAEGEGDSLSLETDDGSDGDKEGESESKTESGGGQTSSEKQGGQGSDEDDAPIVSHTDEAYKQNEQRLFNNNGKENTYLNLPTFDLDKVIYDHKKLYKYLADIGVDSMVEKDIFVNHRNSIKNSVSYLVKEFEMKKNADNMKKASTAKTGDLHMGRVYSYKFNEDIFKKVSVVPDGKSHGLVMFIDWSGSMIQYIEDTVKQLIQLVMFCKKVNIPYEVYAFSDTQNDNNQITIPKPNSIFVENDFVLFNILSNRMTAMEFTNACNVLLSCSKAQNFPGIFRLGGTPLNEALMAATQIVPEFQKKNRLQIVNTIVLTDGEGNCGEFIYYDREMRQRNISAYSYGYTHNVFITDPVTKAQAKITDLHNSRKNTTAIAHLLKQRSGCNLIGFYLLCFNEFKGAVYRYGLKWEDTESFRKNNHVIASVAGFDEYYFLKTKKNPRVYAWYKSNNTTKDMDDEDDDGFDTKATTNKGIANAFSKYAGAKVANRVVLNRFINLIT